VIPKIDGLSLFILLVVKKVSWKETNTRCWSKGVRTQQMNRPSLDGGQQWCYLLPRQECERPVSYFEEAWPSARPKKEECLCSNRIYTLEISLVLLLNKPSCFGPMLFFCYFVLHGNNFVVFNVASFSNLLGPETIVVIWPGKREGREKTGQEGDRDYCHPVDGLSQGDEQLVILDREVQEFQRGGSTKRRTEETTVHCAHLPSTKCSRSFLCFFRASEMNIGWWSPR